jgi:hypothetical protein
MTEQIEKMTESHGSEVRRVDRLGRAHVGSIEDAAGSVLRVSARVGSIPRESVDARGSVG